MQVAPRVGLQGMQGTLLERICPHGTREIRRVGLQGMQRTPLGKIRLLGKQGIV